MEVERLAQTNTVNIDHLRVGYTFEFGDSFYMVLEPQDEVDNDGDVYAVILDGPDTGKTKMIDCEAMVIPITFKIVEIK